MNATEAKAADINQGEALRQPGPDVDVRYEVVIKRITSRETHVQDWRVLRTGQRQEYSTHAQALIPAVPDVVGYITTCKVVNEEREVFRAAFGAMPNISQIADLFETAEHTARENE